MVDTTPISKEPIKLFLSVKKFYNLQGQYRYQANPYNGKNLLFTFFSAQMLITATVFFIFGASSVYEYGATLFAITTETLALVVFNNITWSVNDISNLIERFEIFIKKSIKIK